MTTYNTGNPIGSKDPRDLYDNAENLDTAVNDINSDTWTDRLGRSRKTMFGMEREFNVDQALREHKFNTDQADREARFNTFITSSGYQFLGDYAAGIEITEYNHVVRDSSGEFWRLSGEVELPYTTTGDWGDEEGLFVAVGDAALRQELANPDMGAAMLGRGVVAVDSIADLLALPEEYRREDLRYLVRGYHAGSDVGGGEFYWDTSRTNENDGGTVFNGFCRKVENGTVYLEWFDIDITGTLEMQDVIRAAIAATPQGGKLVYPSVDGTLLVDVPLEGLNEPRAATFNKPMTVEGGGRLVTKIKDFSTAYSDYKGVGSCYVIAASDVTVRGLVVDANADNHYEVDEDGYKWWETGPELKRPYNGITVHAEEGEPNVKNPIVEDCIIYRPLAGVAAVGAVSNRNDAFVSGTLTEGCVVNPIFRNNTTYFARGNDYLFVSGVYGGRIHNNKSVNSMYHPVRFYTSCFDCHMHDNTAIVDYQEIKDRYNETDLGYWRTNRADSIDYPIVRTGYCIGSVWSHLPPYRHSIADCSMTGNSIRHIKRDGVSDIYTVGPNLSAFRVRGALENILVEGNRSYNCPSNGIVVSVDNNEGIKAEGLVITRNIIFGAESIGGEFSGKGIDVYDNDFIDCFHGLSGGVGRERVISLEDSDGTRFYKNRIKAGANSLNSAAAILVAGNPNNLFVSDNMISSEYSRKVRTIEPDAIVHGTDGYGVPATLKNGWQVRDTGVQYAPLTMYIDCEGIVTINCVLRSYNATANVAMNLPPQYSTLHNNLYFPVAGTMENFATAARVVNNEVLILNYNTTAEGDLVLAISFRGKGFF